MFNAMSDVPSKSTNKNRSGRAGRKMYAGQHWLRRAGGKHRDHLASLADAGTPLCHVVPDHKGRTISGAPNRNVGPGTVSSARAGGATMMPAVTKGW